MKLGPRIVAMACAASALGAAPADSQTKPIAGSGVAQLRTYPAEIYFTTANAKERLSGAALVLVVEEPIDVTSTPKALELSFKRAGSTMRTEHLLPPALEAIDIPNLPPTRIHSSEAAKKIHWPHAYRFVISIPAKEEVDSIEARLTLRRDGADNIITTTIPVRSYVPKTALVFPFKGPGIISQGGVLQGGHRNRSGQYAIDALGLSPTYGPMRAPEPDEDPANYAGWGREIIAPAAGKIVVATSDRPDQPVAGKADAAYFRPQYPEGGDPGNYVVIDHGNGEFSMIAHMQKGSVRVKAGDTVAQGAMIGLLGNSGDTSGPHVHYQLQNGPDWESADALPARFNNVESLERGSYFTAR